MITAIVNIVVILEGGATYSELMNMPIPELFVLSEEANRVNKSRGK